MEASQTGAAADRQPAATPVPTEQRSYVVAPVTASGTALGLAGFALSTFLLSMYNGHLVSLAGEPVIFPMLLLYGGIAQFIGGMWAFLAGNPFAAVIFGSYGAFWAGLWLLLTHYLKMVPAGGVANHALGLFLWSWALFTTLMFLAALPSNLAVLTTVGLLVIVEIILAIGYDSGSVSTVKIGGYVGIALAASAWYTMLSIILESTFGRPILPVFPTERLFA
jgi:succinate-acetate transporter protein